MVILQNSTVMPEPGHYILRRIDRAEFIDLLVRAHQHGALVNRIGYRQNLDLIHQWTGIRLEVNRQQTSLENTDILLCMYLRYRTQGRKGEHVSPDAFQFANAYFFRE